MVPCHKCQIYEAWRNKEVGEDFKVIIRGGGEPIMGRVDPFRHHLLKKSSRLAQIVHSSLTYNSPSFSLNFTKVNSKY